MPRRACAHGSADSPSSTPKPPNQYRSASDVLTVNSPNTHTHVQGRLLHPHEWLHYSRSLAPGVSPAERMVVAAQVVGDSEEARFWSHLPCTLAVVREREQQREARVGVA